MSEYLKLDREVILQNNNYKLIKTHYYFSDCKDESFNSEFNRVHLYFNKKVFESLTFAEDYVTLKILDELNREDFGIIQFKLKDFESFVKEIERRNLQGRIDVDENRLGIVYIHLNNGQKNRPTDEYTQKEFSELIDLLQQFISCGKEYVLNYQMDVHDGTLDSFFE